MIAPRRLSCGEVRTRARLTRTELPTGRWVRAVRLPDPRLRAVLARPLVGYEQRGVAAFGSWLEPPHPALSLLIDLEGQLTLDGSPLPGDWIAGLGDRYAVVGFSREYASLDLQLTPLGAYRILGAPLEGLSAGGISLEQAFGVAGRRLVERVRETAGWDERFDAVEAFLLDRLARAPHPTPAVAWAVGQLWKSGGSARVKELAHELGCSRRYLHARFREEVGLAPKPLARLIRFQSVRRRIETAPARWADIAAGCGYADQAHLNRDFRQLAGTTPTDFARRLLPGGGLVGDQIPFVQD